MNNLHHLHFVLLGIVTPNVLNQMGNDNLIHIFLVMVNPIFVINPIFVVADPIFVVMVNPIFVNAVVGVNQIYGAMVVPIVNFSDHITIVNISDLNDKVIIFNLPSNEGELVIAKLARLISQLEYCLFLTGLVHPGTRIEILLQFCQCIL